MNADRQLHWGILGASRMARVMLPEIACAEGARLVAVASRRAGAAAELLGSLPGERDDVRGYDDPLALLADPRVEAVYLPMANEEHGEWVRRCLEAGKHVLVEKPMALSPADIDAIARTAAGKGLLVMEGFMYRFHPQHQRVHELIAAGTFGEIRTVRTCFSFLMTPARLYRVSRPTEQGGGILWDVGCYAVHTARWFYPHPPEAVVAMAHFNEHGADVSLSGAFDFGAGRFAQFDCSFQRARRAEYEIIGTKGGIKCHNVWAKPGEIPEISWWTENGQRCHLQLPPANHFRLEIEHFSACVLENREPALGMEDARGNCRALKAVLEAIQEGKKVAV